MSEPNITVLQRVISKIDDSVKNVLDEISKEELRKTSLLSLIGLSSEIGSGILVLLRIGNCESAIMLERNLYELWCEIRLLFDSSENEAAKLLFNSLEELKSFYGDSKNNEAIKDVTRKLREKFSKEENQIIKQRKNRKYHWSGLSISSVIRKVAADSDTSIYKLLSWESHASMTCLRDRLNIEGNKIVIGSKMPGYMAKELIAKRTGAYLYFIWNEFAEIFEFDEIHELKYKAN